MQTCKWLVRKVKSTVAQTKALATAMPNLSLGVVVRSISLNIETLGTLQIALGRFRYLPTLNPKPKTHKPRTKPHEPQEDLLLSLVGQSLLT